MRFFGITLGNWITRKFANKNDSKCRVAVSDDTEHPDDYDRNIKIIKRIMKDNDELLRKLAKL